MRLEPCTRAGWRSTRRLLFTLVCVVVLVFTAAPAALATSPEERDATDFTSLSSAITTANTDPQGRPFLVHVRANIELAGTDALPAITGKVTLRGDLNGATVGANRATISRANGGVGRILIVDATGSSRASPCQVALENIRFAGGRAKNSAQSTLKGATTRFDGGGALLVKTGAHMDLSVLDTVFYNNSVVAATTPAAVVRLSGLGGRATRQARLDGARVIHCVMASSL